MVAANHLHQTLRLLLPAPGVLLLAGSLQAAGGSAGGRRRAMAQASNRRMGWRAWPTGRACKAFPVPATQSAGRPRPTVGWQAAPHLLLQVSLLGGQALRLILFAHGLLRGWGAGQAIRCAPWSAQHSGHDSPRRNHFLAQTQRSTHTYTHACAPTTTLLPCPPPPHLHLLAGPQPLDVALQVHGAVPHGLRLTRQPAARGRRARQAQAGGVSGVAGGGGGGGDAMRA